MVLSVPAFRHLLVPSMIGRLAGHPAEGMRMKALTRYPFESDGLCVEGVSMVI